MDPNAIGGLARMIPLRRSVRAYHPDKEVPEDVLTSLVESALQAPSPHNTRPWRYVAFNDPGLKQRLALAMGKKMEADMRGEGAGTPEIEKKRKQSFLRITASPEIIIACVDHERVPPFSNRKRMWGERMMAEQSLAASVQNFLLAAEAAGLAASWMAAPLYCQNTVRKILGLPKSLSPQALVTLGYARTQPTALEKPSVNNFLLRI